MQYYDVMRGHAMFRGFYLPHLKGNTIPVIGIIFVELVRKDHHGDLLPRHKLQHLHISHISFSTQTNKEANDGSDHNLIMSLFCSGNITYQ